MYKLTTAQFHLIAKWLNTPGFMDYNSYLDTERIKEWFLSEECTAGADYTKIRSLLVNTRDLWVWYITPPKNKK